MRNPGVFLRGCVKPDLGPNGIPIHHPTVQTVNMQFTPELVGLYSLAQNIPFPKEDYQRSLQNISLLRFCQ